MLQLKNSVAMLALVAVACIVPPPTVAQDQPAAEPTEDLESLVNSLSPDDPAVADDVIPLPEVELLTEAELDELVAPVALYPDALLAQVLVASTFPLQVVKADRIIAESEDLSDEALSETLSEQDCSIRACSLSASSERSSLSAMMRSALTTCNGKVEATRTWASKASG